MKLPPLQPKMMLKRDPVTKKVDYVKNDIITPLKLTQQYETICKSYLAAYWTSYYRRTMRLFTGSSSTTRISFSTFQSILHHQHSSRPIVTAHHVHNVAAQIRKRQKLTETINEMPNPQQPSEDIR